MTIISKRAIIPHGVVFLYDPSMIVNVPNDTSEAPILYTDNCVSIWTLQEDDGEVMLTLADELTDVSGSKVFEGILKTDGRQIAFNDSAVDVLLNIIVSGRETTVSLFTNNSRYPDSVTAVVHTDS